MQARLTALIAAFTLLAAACSSSPRHNATMPTSTTAVGASQTLSFTVPSESMLPTLKVGQVIKVRPISSDNHVGRGDIIVFKAPEGSDPGIDDLVKRVIGLPGESVSAHDGHVYIDNKEPNEPYLPKGTFTSDFAAVKVPPHCYWVMGDNRDNSKDSRVFGPISRRDIIGTVKPS